jgi:hypothetical protein
LCKCVFIKDSHDFPFTQVVTFPMHLRETGLVMSFLYYAPSSSS